LEKLVRSVLRDGAAHLLKKTEEDIRISVVEFAWAIDLLLKVAVLRREGDLLDEKQPKIYKSTADLLAHLLDDLGFDSFDALPPSTRTSVFTVIQGREDSWHRGAQFEIEELQAAIAGCIEFVKRLSTDAGMDLAEVVGTEFMMKTMEQRGDQRRIAMHVRRAEKSRSLGDTFGTFTAATSALQQMSFYADNLSEKRRLQFPTVAYKPAFWVLAAPPPEKVEQLYNDTISFYDTLRKAKPRPRRRPRDRNE